MAMALDGNAVRSVDRAAALLLALGDTHESWIERIGTIRNHCVAPA